MCYEIVNNGFPFWTSIAFNPDSAFHTYRFDVGQDGYGRWYRDGIEKYVMTGVPSGYSFIPELSTSDTSTRFDNVLVTQLGTPDVSFSIDDVSIVEGTGATKDAVFTVSLSQALSQPASVTYATAGGSATAGADYTAASGNLNFAAGVLTQTIVVPILGDIVQELDAWPR